MVDAGKTKHPTLPHARIPSVAESASVLHLVVCSLRVMVITIVKQLVLEGAG